MSATIYFYCSEVSALLSAVAHDDTDIQSIYVAARRNDGKPCAILTPCGNCRQVISDFSVVARHPIAIFCTNDKLEEVITMTSDELLPATFRSVALSDMMAAK
jgi:cytidine deaminase